MSVSSASLAKQGRSLLLGLRVGVAEEMLLGIVVPELSDNGRLSSTLTKHQRHVQNGYEVAACGVYSREPDVSVQVRGEGYTARPKGQEHLIGFSTSRCQQRTLDVLAVDQPTQDIFVRHLRNVSWGGVEISVGNVPRLLEGR